MSNISGVVRQSVLSTISPEEEAARRYEVKQLQGPLKKLVALSLHEAAVHYPDQVGRLIGLKKQREQTAEFIAAGFDALVFKDGDHVVKVHKRSLGVSTEEQAMIKARRTRTYATMHRVMPDFTIAQETTIGTHPHYPDLSAVVTRQAYVEDLKDTDLFDADHHINHVNLQELTRRPGMTSQLRDFTAAAARLRDHHQLIPDLWGKQNLVINSDDRLVIIDGQPLGMFDPLDQEVVAQTNFRLSNMQAALASL